MSLWRLAVAAAVISAPGGALDFRNAAIVIRPGATPPERAAARMLSEEIEKRTQLRLPVVHRSPESGPIIELTEPAIASESVTLTSSAPRERPRATVAGHAVFGAGLLLRRFRMDRQRLELPANLRIATAPKVAIRGHQLGYRPKTNAYDGWSVPMWDQYVRELAIFGANTIELIPPNSDDADDSPHFPLPKMEMMIEMSRIADSYGLNVSIWYPMMDPSHPDWDDVFRRLPRVNAVFVPGGDPGHIRPRVLFELLARQAASLRRYHPGAEFWVSPQGFSREWMDEFYALLGARPAWLTGVVHGPQVRDSVAEMRRRVPASYRLRLYPDITHSMECQFPVPDWDPAFAATEGRESINPRPLAHAAIFRELRPFADGFVTYSEGANDDVNKFVWSALGWNPDQPIEDILLDYSRFFIGGDAAEPFAAGLLELEKNWKAPLRTNMGVDRTAAMFRRLEEQAAPRQRLNWRFQAGIYRACYDAWLRGRLIAEEAQESRALAELSKATRTGSLTAMQRAEEVLDADVLPVAARAFRARVFELAEALFQSIHMQLSVARYQAISMDRGANLDAIDFALNNRVWLRKQFEAIRALNAESERLARIDGVVNWENPGKGGFYDDLGKSGAEPRLVHTGSVITGFGELTPEQGWRTSWYTDAESLYDQPVRMKYTGLDPGARYRVRVLYGGDMQSVPIRLLANEKFEIHSFMKKSLHPSPLEFDIPPEATRGGTLLLDWTRPAGLGGNGRGCQVSEVWLIRRQP